MLELLTDSLLDCVKLLPFLFLSYLAVEYIEHKMSYRTKMMIYRAGKAGPILGSILGVVPQCGFAAAAAGLYAGGIVTPGTLLAVFLSSSDEMLPIMISEGVHVGMISKILIVKVVIGMAAGLLLDVVAGHFGWGVHHEEDVTEFCEHGHCHCERSGVLKGALNHTVQITGFLFLITLVLGFLMDHVEMQSLSQILGGVRGVEELLAGLVGMIPNCAASVLVTQLYLQGFINSGALFSGLLCGAGAGLLVLYRANGKWKENLLFTVILYVTGVIGGLLVGASGLVL
jgi:hypothetical protein